MHRVDTGRECAEKASQLQTGMKSIENGDRRAASSRAVAGEKAAPTSCPLLRQVNDGLTRATACAFAVEGGFGLPTLAKSAIR